MINNRGSSYATLLLFFFKGDNMSKHIDKRTKEYKDSIKDKGDNMNNDNTSSDNTSNENVGNVEEVSEVDVLKAEMLEMKEIMKTMGQVAANNAKAIKNKNTNIKKPITIVRPRAAEMAILVDFLEQFQGSLAYDKDLCGKIALNSIMRPNVDALNEVIKRQNTLNKKAIEVGLYVDNDFTTIKIQNK